MGLFTQDTIMTLIGINLNIKENDYFSVID